MVKLKVRKFAVPALAAGNLGEAGYTAFLRANASKTESAILSNPYSLPRL
jgi:hypothetical protein